MKITVAGCGDAFGSGGRLQSCYHLETTNGRVLLDCGATATIGLERAKLDPAGVDTIVISHLHGDHFGGLVWWLLRAVYIERRTRPLTIAGPPGITQRLWAASDALYPGLRQQRRPFQIEFHELEAGRRDHVGPIVVTPFEVVHPSGAPSYALRVEADGRVLAFSGDTEWTEALIACAGHANLFLCECFGYEKAVRNHLDWYTLSRKLRDIGAEKVMLTHLGPDMLAHLDDVRGSGAAIAEDGLTMDV
ncbi:MAG: MBL fold metallo-hydrolase [Hyphomicrobiaceae bacterium]